MSTTYRTATESASSILGLGLQPSATETSSPLSQILPYIAASFSVLTSASRVVLSLFRPLLLLSPLPVLSYIFAPLLVFLDIVATIFIRSPYRILVYLLDALFPLYVFCGVACITGGLLGLIGRVLCRVVVASVQVQDESASEASGERSSRGRAQVKLEAQSVDMQEKGRKAERVKFES
ncbi:hypothetical protein BDZ97DRAFT_1915104 [Flammula alnicola]|nr:hypothetical protein BDZ97DRAFT_1915104 [Flammula alnicola]